ncbi:hypothetical protein DUNSADRAFT_11858 [Dunaliella salina]|uniref:Uncharacterized protein n=1 Tax=Dunaliella salina TaxID=3046 RepID=A0ABQ7GCG4_DUNSA|nr:hypothetical protein DUNSADRAFT_11858 [Dunaliella salina]|eukprot:KAF5832293.1 hypothetical protein DUNSADRAFT_11858 [Dunaliella salina]
MESWEGPYDQLLLRQNWAVLELWPKPFAVFVAAEAAQLYSAGECSTGHTVIAVAGCLCCLALIKAIEYRRTNLIRCIFLAIGCLQMAGWINYTRGKDTLNNVHLYFDVGTTLYAVTPQLVMGLNGLPIEAYILFIGCHVASSALLYFSVARMSWYFALLRALGIHTLTIIAALVVHKRAHDFVLSSHQRASQQQPKQQHESFCEAGSAKQSSRAVTHTPLASQIVSWPAISTKVVRHLLVLLRQRPSTLHTDSSLTPQGAQAGSASNREPQGGMKIVLQQAQRSQSQAEPGTQGKQQQQQQQQQHIEGASGKGNTATGQEGAPSKQANGMQQGASGCNSSNNHGKKAWTSSYPSTHQTQSALGSSNPVLQEAMVQAARELEQRCSQEKLYTSKLVTQYSRQGPQRAPQSVRRSCRLILKLHGLATPDQIPSGGLAQLQHKLQKYQCLAPAVRSGCLVISCDAAPCIPACTLEEMSKAALAWAKEWAHEQGLLGHGEDLMTVQACCSTYWDDALDGEPSPVYSMAVHTPFLIPTAGGFNSASSIQKQQQDHAGMDGAMGKQGHAGNQAPEDGQRQAAVCEFELTLCAPEGELELHGWQGAEDAPEAVKSRSLCLLASLEGQFLGVTVKKRSLKKDGERVVQVCVSLPADSFDTSSHLKPLTLELWASGHLVSSYTAMLLTPSSSTGAAALAELQGWTAGLTGTLPEEDSGPFMLDLVEWMHFQTYAQQQRQQQQQGMGAARDPGLPEEPMQQQQQQQLELMRAVGVDLLEFSLSTGMQGVAGLLLECFAAFPFCTPPLTLLDTHSLLSKLQPLSTEEVATGEKGDLVEEAISAIPETALRPKDKTDAPPASTGHSSTQLHDHLHSSPSPAALTPNTPNTAAALTCVSTASSAVRCKLAAVARGLHSQLFKEDADFNAWTNSQVAPLARAWCRVWLLGIGLGALRMALTEGVPPFLEISSQVPVLLGYTAGALFIRPGSRHSEVILAAISAVRSSFAFMLGIGILPLSGTQMLLLRWRSEVPAEIIMMSVMERVRLSWMVPQRAFLTVSLWLLYARLGLPYPALQSVCVNLCSLGVSAAMEQRYRSLYPSPRLSAKQQALADGDTDFSASPKPNSQHRSAKAGKGEHPQR